MRTFTYMLVALLCTLLPLGVSAETTIYDFNTTNGFTNPNSGGAISSVAQLPTGITWVCPDGKYVWETYPGDALHYGQNVTGGYDKGFLSFNVKNNTNPLTYIVISAKKGTISMQVRGVDNKAPFNQGISFIKLTKMKKEDEKYLPDGEAFFFTNNGLRNQAINNCDGTTTTLTDATTYKKVTLEVPEDMYLGISINGLNIDDLTNTFEAETWLETEVVDTDGNPINNAHIHIAPNANLNEKLITSTWVGDGKYIFTSGKGDLDKDTWYQVVCDIPEGYTTYATYRTSEKYDNPSQSVGNSPNINFKLSNYTGDNYVSVIKRKFELQAAETKFSVHAYVAHTLADASQEETKLVKDLVFKLYTQNLNQKEELVSTQTANTEGGANFTLKGTLPAKLLLEVESYFNDTYKHEITLENPYSTQGNEVKFMVPESETYREFTGHVYFPEGLSLKANVDIAFGHVSQNSDYINRKYMDSEGDYSFKVKGAADTDEAFLLRVTDDHYIDGFGWKQLSDVKPATTTATDLYLKDYVLTQVNPIVTINENPTEEGDENSGPGDVIEDQTDKIFDLYLYAGDIQNPQEAKLIDYNMANDQSKLGLTVKGKLAETYFLKIASDHSDDVFLPLTIAQEYKKFQMTGNRVDATVNDVEIAIPISKTFCLFHGNITYLGGRPLKNHLVHLFVGPRVEAAPALYADAAETETHVAEGTTDENGDFAIRLYGQPSDEHYLRISGPHIDTPTYQAVQTPSFMTSYPFNINLANETITGISAVSAPATEGEIFSLDGRALGTDSTRLAPGLYIIAGKKTILK